MESKQIQELEKLLNEYRALMASNDSTPKIDDEAHSKVCEEKKKLEKQVVELNQTIETLKLQLEHATPNVSGCNFLNP